MPQLFHALRKDVDRLEGKSHEVNRLNAKFVFLKVRRESDSKARDLHASHL